MDKSKMIKGIFTFVLTMFICVNPFIAYIGTTAGYFNKMPNTYDAGYFALIKTFSVIALVLTVAILALNLASVFAPLNKYTVRSLRGLAVALLLTLLVFLLVARGCVPVGANGYWATTDASLYIAFRNAFMIPILVYTTLITLITNAPLHKVGKK